jgi:hypothetical protein
LEILFNRNTRPPVIGYSSARSPRVLQPTSSCGAHYSEAARAFCKARDSPLHCLPTTMTRCPIDARLHPMTFTDGRQAVSHRLTALGRRDCFLITRIFPGQHPSRASWAPAGQRKHRHVVFHRGTSAPATPALSEHHHKTNVMAVRLTPECLPVQIRSGQVTQVRSDTVRSES